MASILKRKRGAVEVADTPKRAKSVKKDGLVRKDGKDKKVDWEAAMGENGEGKELVMVDEREGLMNGNAEKLEVENSKDPGLQKKDVAKLSDAPVETKAGKSIEKPSLWKLSESIGGRMSNLEPVFTADEK